MRMGALREESRNPQSAIHNPEWPMLRMIVCDWNGTLFRDTLEETFFFGLCRRAALRALGRGDVGKLARLAATGAKCYRQYRAARRDADRVPEHVARIVELLDADVFSGLTRAELGAYARRYARRIQPRLDRRLLEPLGCVRAERGVPLAVVSSGCREGIEAALDEAAAHFDFVVANEFRWAGAVTAGFDFRIAGDKLAAFDGLLAERGIDAADVMYVGDSPQDAPCFARVGAAVMSFWATGAHKQRLAAAGRVFVPADRADFERHLRRLTG